MNALTRATPATPTLMHGPSLAAALLVMVGGTLYPPLMADAAGFVPRFVAWRVLFSGWAVLAALALALVFKLMH